MGAAQRIEEIQQFLITNADERFINLVFSMVQSEKGDQPISIEQYNRELETANARVDSGEYLSQAEVKQESASWLK